MDARLGFNVLNSAQHLPHPEPVVRLRGFTRAFRSRTLTAPAGHKFQRSSLTP